MKGARVPLPEVKVNVLKKDRMQPGWTLTNFSNRELGLPILAVVIDPNGEIRWIYQTDDKPDVHGCIDVRTDSKGVLIGGAHGRGSDAYFPVLVNWDQEVLWEGKIAVDPHHAHRRKNGNFYLLGAERREIEKPEKCWITSHNILEVESETTWGPGIVWMWRLFDHLTPTVARRDWSHCNTIEEDPEGRYLYLSPRNLNSVLKIDRNTEGILWRLGEDGDFKVSGEDMFYHQHSPELQPNGNLLIFDNGTGRPEKYGGAYSRAVELEIDEDKMKAKAVWSWGKELGLYTPIWGDADRLGNGNTLITFGTRTHPDTSRLIEVTPKGEVVWDIELKPSGWGMYRAERLSEDLTKSIPYTHG